MFIVLCTRPRTQNPWCLVSIEHAIMSAATGCDRHQGPREVAATLHGLSWEAESTVHAWRVPALKELGVWRMLMGAEPATGTASCRMVGPSRLGSRLSASGAGATSSSSRCASFSSPRLYTSVPLTSTTNLQPAGAV